MKKLVLIAAVVVMSAAAVSAFVYVNNGKNSMGELFNANVEALTESEIIVGNLCMVCRNSACTSLGVVYEEHIKA